MASTWTLIIAQGSEVSELTDSLVTKARDLKLDPTMRSWFLTQPIEFGLAPPPPTSSSFLILLILSCLIHLNLNFVFLLLCSHFMLACMLG